MAKIKRNIKQQPLLDRVAKGAEIATACTGNPNASTLTAKLSALATQNTALQTAVSDTTAAFDAWQAAAAAQAPVADSWNAAFDALADAAFVATAGDESKIASLGLQSYAPGGAPSSGTPGQVLNVSATTGDFEGKLDVAWDKTAGARSYEAQITTTPGDSSSYHHAGISFKTSMTISGLVSGTKYWVRVAAIGSSGQGPWSDPATKMAG